MRINTTELDSGQGAVVDYQPEPTFYEQLVAMKNQVKSQTLTTSGMNYTADALSRQIEEINKLTGKDFNHVKRLTGGNLVMAEHLWKSGNLKSRYGEYTGGQYQEYFDTVQANNLKNVEVLKAEGNGFAAKDYWEAEEILVRGDSTTAKLIGGMAGAMHDPLNLALLPFGGTAIRTASQGIMATAGKAAVTEMSVATMIEPVIQMATLAQSEAIGVSYDIKDAATNAILSIGAAGLIRGTGSAALDLTSDGIKALRVKDPDLADSYEALAKNNISSDLGEHIDNLDRVKNGEPLEFKEITPEAQALRDAPNVKEFEEPGGPPEEMIDYKGDLEYITGKDIDGQDTYTSYKAQSEALEAEIQRYKKIEDCLL